MAGRHRPLRRVGLGLAVAALVLAGCARPNAMTYANVDAVASQLNPQHAGVVIYAGHWGTGGFSQESPTLMYVIGGPDAYATIAAQLRHEGWASTPDQPGEWVRPTSIPHVQFALPGQTPAPWPLPSPTDAAGKVSVYLWQRNAGDTYTAANGYRPGGKAQQHVLSGPAAQLVLTDPYTSQ